MHPGLFDHDDRTRVSYSLKVRVTGCNDAVIARGVMKIAVSGASTLITSRTDTAS